jgi:hypothetical protein
VDNCLGVSASITGATVHFLPTGAGNEAATVDHYTVFATSDGSNLVKLAEMPVGARSVDLSRIDMPAGTHTVYVKMQSRAGILNKMSNGVQYAR